MDRTASEGPQHEVTIATPFAVSRFEMTFEEWDACVAAAACPRVTDRWGRGPMPVIDVNWDDARQYVGWLSQMTGKDYRLLTESEWEYAAQQPKPLPAIPGVTTPLRKTPIATAAGVTGTANKRRLSDRSSRTHSASTTCTVTSGEWVEDGWHERLRGRVPIDASAWLQDSDPEFRVARGGSWNNESERVRAAYRVERNRHVQFSTLGFRVARTMRKKPCDPAIGPAGRWSAIQQRQ